MFEKSNASNASYVPTQYQLAKISMGKGNTDDAATRIQNILTRLNPDANFRQYSIDLGNQVYNKYIVE